MAHSHTLANSSALMLAGQLARFFLNEGIVFGCHKRVREGSADEFFTFFMRQAFKLEREVEASEITDSTTMTKFLTSLKVNKKRA